jgi:hypothetical protein
MVELMQYLLVFSAYGLVWAAFAWVFLSISLAIISNERGRSGFGFFLLAIFFSPIVGVLFLIASPDRAREKRDTAARTRDAEDFKASIQSLWQQLITAARQGTPASSADLPPPFAGRDPPGTSRVPSPPQAGHEALSIPNKPPLVAKRI